MNLNSESEVKQLILSRLSEPGTRQKCLEIFAASIAEANIYGRDKWAVTCEDDRFIRLIVEHIIICTLCDGAIWLALDKGLLESSDKRRSILEDAKPDWTWDKGEFAEYPAIQAKNGYYKPTEKHAEIWPGIRRLHFESIYRAATGRIMDSRTPGKHEPEVLKYLRNELGRHVPDPFYKILG